jgi:magnesium chelatase subunit D
MSDSGRTGTGTGPAQATGIGVTDAEVTGTAQAGNGAGGAGMSRAGAPGSEVTGTPAGTGPAGAGGNGAGGNGAGGNGAGGGGPRFGVLPFAAVVGQDEARLALLLGAVDPGIGGVLLTGEKGTAKTTLVRGLADILPGISVVAGCRFSCDPAAPDPACPDGPHPAGAAAQHRPARLVELPLGATDDRITGSLDVPRVLAGAPTAEAFVPGLLALAHRGVLYVDEINLLPDHLVDVLLDAAATGATTVEREGISLRHASQFLLVGTMNPEEGELRPQLLDRFGLCVPVVASADPRRRADAVRARLSHDRHPAASIQEHGAAGHELTSRIAAARAQSAGVELADPELLRITTACATLGVDGLRGDLVTARAAIAHAAWESRPAVAEADIRAAARLALPHRRRRGPFDDPGMNDAQLDDAFGPAPEPGPDSGSPESAGQPEPGRPREPDPADGGPGDASQAGRPGETGSGDAPEPEGHPDPPDRGGGGAAAGPPWEPTSLSKQAPPPVPHPGRPPEAGQPHEKGGAASAVQIVYPFRGDKLNCSLLDIRRLEARGRGTGSGGRRSRSQGPGGRPAGTARTVSSPDLTATLRAAALARPGQPFAVTASDLRRWLRRGRESNLVILLLDTSGSMAARRRSTTVSTVALSLLRDSYRRRDRVALLTFRGREATVVVPPTRSAGLAAQRLRDLPAGGQTPLAAGLEAAGRLAQREHWREPSRRPLLVVVTDGRATGGGNAVGRARHAARLLAGISSVVVDAEDGPVRLGLAGLIATDLGADLVTVAGLASASPARRDDAAQALAAIIRAKEAA